MHIEVNRVIQQALASGWKLDKYVYLIERAHDVDVVNESGFRRAFNDFWRIFPYEKNMSDRVFETMQWAKSQRNPTFKEILERISPNDRVNKAAASKILATLDPSIAPCDGNTLKALGLRDPTGSKQLKIARAVEVFDYIQDWYAEELASPVGDQIVQAFDEALPNYKSIHSVKKLDFILWSYGAKLAEHGKSRMEE